MKRRKSKSLLNNVLGKCIALTLLLNYACMPKSQIQDTGLSSNGNPIIPGYFADPSIFMDDDSTFYIYATTDGYDVGKFTNGPFGVWKSKDFKSWKFYNFDYPQNFPYVSEKHWAPSVTKGADGRYYMYFVKDGYDCFVVSSESPTGPWIEENGGKVVYENMFDAEVFKDTDGSYYLIYQAPKIEGKYSLWLGRLKENMVEFEGEPQKLYENFDLFEGPGMFKRNGKYYLLYSAGGLGGSYHVNAAYGGENIWGPYQPHNEKEKKYDPIIKPIPEKNMISTGHNSVLKIDSEYYMVYHRKAYPYRKGSDLWRQVAIEKLQFDENGRLISIKPTEEGINPLGGSLKPTNNKAYATMVKASSTKDSLFNAGFVTDMNNGTMWKAKENTYPQTIEIDLGKPIELNEVLIYFEYATEAYRYTIESSKNGVQWELIADKTENKELACPTLDAVKTKARYIKIRVTGSGKQNQAVGIWEVICK